MGVSVIFYCIMDHIVSVDALTIRLYYYDLLTHLVQMNARNNCMSLFDPGT